MTEKEEAIIILDGFKDNPLFNEQHKKALDMAIKALSENKRDLISRGEVESVLHNNLHALIDTDELYQLYKDINHLPTYSFPDSAENKGEWKMPIQDDGMSDPIYYQVRCSKCGFDLDPQTWHQELHQYGADNFCPNCGADMRGGKDK